ncbi:c-type cytochrome [Paraburkholderia dinghuensis]|uniref:Cytochrome c domain-containing protein n=1 Tax=Paraburkholderia dinghuensis TaxID=2305225 RepID=A0A3N6MN36_9BURK|nr:c-type cytochrome [Paraburkholderia dinghuensis]RQH04948.1 hypothetical protein D1Y85_16165 [Paraburkholderia dinghuensis]
MKVRSASALIFSVVFSCAAFAQTGEQLAKAKGCTACHSVDGVGVGPSFHDIAQRFAGLKNARPMLIRIVKTGTGSGPVPYHWGDVKMPPDSARVPVNEAEAKELIDYVLSQR